MPHVSSRTIQQLSSEYIDQGKSQESWSIQSAYHEGDHFEAEVSIDDYYCSKTDNGTFHLSVMTALEIASQLLIIFEHLLEGYEQKSKEVWMLDCTIKSHKAIRQHNDLKVSLQREKSRKLRGRKYATTSAIFTDGAGGHFQITMKTCL